MSQIPTIRELYAGGALRAANSPSVFPAAGGLLDRISIQSVSRSFLGSCCGLGDVIEAGRAEPTIHNALCPTNNARSLCVSNGSLSHCISRSKGDITKMDVDAIVNAANRSLLGSSISDMRIMALLNMSCQVVAEV